MNSLNKRFCVCNHVYYDHLYWTKRGNILIGCSKLCGCKDFVLMDNLTYLEMKYNEQESSSKN